MTFAELKQWFRENYRKLPNKLTTDFKIYNDVKHYVVLNIKLIDGIGSGARNSFIANSAKTNLQELYNELNEENNNKKRCI